MQSHLRFEASGTRLCAKKSRNSGVHANASSTLVAPLSPCARCTPRAAPPRVFPLQGADNDVLRLPVPQTSDVRATPAPAHTTAVQITPLRAPTRTRTRTRMHTGENARAHGDARTQTGKEKEKEGAWGPLTKHKLRIHESQSSLRCFVAAVHNTTQRCTRHAIP